ncbi:MAG: aminotransferase class I/II-fold pyridoxal phosphate-dependent enzyme [Alphaproteobacteria bacterium]|nr:aminotransferase class I/II-fold pyridoxal phosphate-dependent enzyme [Alphaproteobacteria bacterium]
MAFDYSTVFRPNLPPAAKRWSGFPKYNFVGGHNDGAAVPVQDFIDAAAVVLNREGSTLATYSLESGSQGYLPLREYLAGFLDKTTGMVQTAEDILLVSGSLQALDLVNDVLLAEGDTVVIEEAAYQGAVQRLNRLGVNVIGAPLDDGGIRMDALNNILNDLKKDGVKPKYLYAVPTVQNPTGTVMPEERRLEFLKLAREFDVPIFEDDCYADLTFDGTRPRAIRALDEDGRVIFCGTFSKTIAPALRVGYIVAEWDILSRMLAVKRDGGSGALEQMVLGEYCPDHFEDHIVKLRGVLKQKCNAMLETLAAEFGTAAEVETPTGGIFVWVTMPDSVDTMKLFEAASAEGVAINPGSEWVADPATGTHKMRLCFGNPTVDEIREGVIKLAEICHREFGVPERGSNIER